MGLATMTTFQVVAPVTVESGKPNKGFGGARRLYGDLRDSYPETFKHLDAKVKPKGSQFKSQAEQIAEAKQRIAAKQGPMTEEKKSDDAASQVWSWWETHTKWWVLHIGIPSSTVLQILSGRLVFIGISNINR